MKASLQLKLGAQLTMTPQLQQAIRLLQLSTLDLQQEIQQALESNPMLELVEEGDQDADEGDTEEAQARDREQADSDAVDRDIVDRDTGDIDRADGDRLDHDRLDHDNVDNDPVHNDSVDHDSADGDGHAQEDYWDSDQAHSEWESQTDIPNDLPVDTAWDDIYQSAPSSASRSDDDDDMDFESRNSAAETLQDHLVWQLNLTPMSDRDRAIATAIVDAIDDDGYLSLSQEEIHEGLHDPDDDDPVELDEVEAVLHRIQHFDPPGVGARDLQECLLIQLNQLPPETPWLPQARLLVSHYLNLLGNRDYAQLMRRSRLNEDQLRAVLGLIQTLTPKPGESLAGGEPDYVIPDVVVRKINGRWRVELNPEIAPRIRVNNSYASLVRRADNSTDNTFMRDQLQEAKWFIKSLVSRNETLLKVATRIVEHQQGFLERGDEAMKPLILSDIAQAVEMHESTISRVTTQKYMHTPRGVFELKYFFSSHVSTDEGGECSSTAIRAMIRKLVSAEAARKPLSDSKIAALLGDQGIKVARRTVAKYREAMQIPPSNERKRLV